MAISFVGSAENSAINGADVTLTLPAMLQDDLVIVAYGVGDNDNVDFNMAMVTAGYTEVADLFSDDTQDANLGVYWKVMGATPDTSAVVDGLGGADAAVAATCMVFRGVDTATPFDVVTTTATGINTMHPNPPAIDHLNPAGLWTVIAGASGHTLGGAGTYTFPTGYTTNALDIGSDDTSDITVGLGYRTNPADPEDPGVMTHSGADSANFAWAACTMALRPKASTTFSQAIPSVAVGIATISPVTTFSRMLLATATGVASLTTALLFMVSIIATTVGVAVLGAVSVFMKTLTVAASGVASLTTQFIAGSVPLINRMRCFLKNIGSMIGPL